MVYKCESPENTSIAFDCRAPKGSVLLSDPVLETELRIRIEMPVLDDREIVYRDNTEDRTTAVLNAGAHPIQGICESVVHRMGPTVIKDSEVYKYLEDWTSLNYCDATRKACDAAGTSPMLHDVLGAGIPETYSVSFPNDQNFTYDTKNDETYIAGGVDGVDEINIALGGLRS